MRVRACELSACERVRLDGCVRVVRCLSAKKTCHGAAFCRRAKIDLFRPLFFNVHLAQQLFDAG